MGDHPGLPGPISSLNPLRLASLFFSILAHVSRSVTARLNTNFPGVESRSTQKYPRRSNWNVLPTAEPATDGSSLLPVRTSSDFGFRFARKV